MLAWLGCCSFQSHSWDKMNACTIIDGASMLLIKHEVWSNMAECALVQPALNQKERFFGRFLCVTYNLVKIFCRYICISSVEASELEEGVREVLVIVGW